MKKAVHTNGLFEIHYPYSVQLTVALRCLPGWSWSGEKKCGIAKATPASIAMLRCLGFELEGVIDEESPVPAAVLSTPKERRSFKGHIDSPFVHQLRPYQIEGVREILGRGGRALLADEMGLGKTIQALTWLEHLSTPPSLIITTGSTKLNWEEEAKKWTTAMGVCVINGMTPYTLPVVDIYIINYNLLKAWKETLIRKEFEQVVIDECHNIKNYTAQRTRATKSICRRVPRILAMSGTPIMSAPIEFYNTFHLLAPDLFGSKMDFGMEYCDPQVDRWSGQLVFKGATNIPKLQGHLSSIMIRRMKADVLKELPAKQRTRINLEIVNRAAYERVLKATKTQLGGLRVINKFQELLTLSFEGKFLSACRWIDDFLENGEKLFVGVFHTEVARNLVLRYGKRALAITGQTPMTKRHEICRRFNEDPSVPLLVGQLEAAGEGINLQKSCSNVAFLEYPWTPSRLVQFEDRVHRFGQQHGTNVWYLVADDTIETHLLDVLLSKADTVSSVMDSDVLSTQSTVASLKQFLLRAR